MYRRQLTWQKIICFAAIVAGALVFLYALGLMTDLYDSLYYTMTNPYDLTATDVPGSIIYYDMQPFNQMLLRSSIGLILLGCLLFLTGNHSRRRYYVGNVVSTVLFVVASLGMSYWIHTQIDAFKAQFLTTLDFEALADFADLWDTPYIDSTLWFDLHWVVVCVLLIVSLALIVNLFWKKILMDGEKKMIGHNSVEKDPAELDRLRFIKNSFSSNMVLLSIVFDVLYFISIYKSDVGSWYYSIPIGASIVYNLVFMLIAFLCSEGIKNYKLGYCFVMIALAAGQIIRIFILPLSAYTSTVTISKVVTQVMQTPQFIRVIVYLSLSSLCLIIGSIVGIRKCRALKAHTASLKQISA